MVSNKNDILMFLQTHKEEMARRFGVVSVGLFGNCPWDYRALITASLFCSISVTGDWYGNHN